MLEASPSLCLLAQMISGWVETENEGMSKLTHGFGHPPSRTGDSHCACGSRALLGMFVCFKVDTAELDGITRRKLLKLRVASQFLKSNVKTRGG